MYHPHLTGKPQKHGKYILEIGRFESISYPNNTTEIWEIFLPPKKIQQKTSVDFSPIFFFFFGRFHRKFRIFFSWVSNPLFAISPVSTDTSRSPNVGNFIRPAGFTELQPQKVGWMDLSLVTSSLENKNPPFFGTFFCLNFRGIYKVSSIS